MVDSNGKGKRGERELAKYLSKFFGTNCRRGQQRSGLDQDDIIGLSGIHVECKRVERLNIHDAIDQAVHDSDGDVPAVFHRRNKKPWLVTVRLEDLKEFAQCILDCSMNLPTCTTPLPKSTCQATDSHASVKDASGKPATNRRTK